MLLPSARRTLVGTGEKPARRSFLPTDASSALVAAD